MEKGEQKTNQKVRQEDTNIDSNTASFPYTFKTYNYI